MPHFALTPDEYSRLKDQDEIDEMYRLAFSRISKAKKRKKGGLWRAFVVPVVAGLL